MASYNVRKAIGTDRRRDPHRVLEVIEGLGADVVALQEADRRLGPRPAALPRDMIREMTGLVPLDLGQSAVSLGSHGNAILVRAEVARGLSGLRRLDLPGFEPRGAVIADLDTPLGRLQVCGAHLGLLRPSRRRQLAVLRGALEGGAAVLMGDFNEPSRRRGFEALGPAFRVHAPGPSFHARRPVVALDRIALAGGLGIARMGVSKHPLARRASDHLPIWAELELA